MSRVDRLLLLISDIRQKTGVWDLLDFMVLESCPGGNELAEKMRASGISEEQIKLARDPLTSFALQLKEEIEEYERQNRS